MNTLSSRRVETDFVFTLELTDVVDVTHLGATCKFVAYMVVGSSLKKIRRIPVRREILEQIMGKLTAECFDMFTNHRPALSSLWDFRKIMRFSIGRGGKITMVVGPVN